VLAVLTVTQKVVAIIWYLGEIMPAQPDRCRDRCHDEQEGNDYKHLYRAITAIGRKIKEPFEEIHDSLAHQVMSLQHDLSNPTSPHKITEMHGCTA
jgi:hypothetical protein